MTTSRFAAFPTGVTPVRIPIGRGSLAALRVGAVSARGTVLAVPGLTGSKEDFVAILPPLAEAGWSAVAVDLFGQFESDGSDDPAAYSLELLARDLAEVIERLADPVVLIGHSFGGLISRHAVLAGSVVRDLVLLDSGPGALPAGRRRPLTEALTAAMSVPVEQAWEMVVAIRTEEGTWPPPQPGLAELLRRRWLATRPAHMAGCAAELLSAPDRTHELIGHRVHVIYGADEDAWPAEHQQEMAARLGVTPVVIAGAAHSPAAEAPEATVAALLTLLAET